MSLPNLRLAREQIKPPSKILLWSRLIGTIVLDAINIIVAFAEIIATWTAATGAAVGATAGATAGTAAGAGTGAATGATVGSIVPGLGTAVGGVVGTVVGGAIGFFGGSSTGAAAGAVPGITALVAAWVSNLTIDAIADVILGGTELIIRGHRQKLVDFHNLILQTVGSDIPTTAQTDQQPSPGYSRRQNVGTIRARQFRSSVSKIASSTFVAKSGLLTAFSQDLLDMVPYVKILPWRSFGLIWFFKGVWGRDREYKKMYKQIIEEYDRAVEFLQREKLTELKQAA